MVSFRALKKAQAEEGQSRMWKKYWSELSLTQKVELPQLRFTQ